MVSMATSFARNGVADWLIQRFTAIVLAAYTIFLALFILLSPELTYETWSGLFDQTWMRAFSLLTLLSILAHGWIGIWGVITDYFTTRLMGSKGLVLRLLVLGIYVVVALACLVWGIEILWGAR